MSRSLADDAGSRGISGIPSSYEMPRCSALAASDSLRWEASRRRRRWRRLVVLFTHGPSLMDRHSWTFTHGPARHLDRRQHVHMAEARPEVSMDANNKGQGRITSPLQSRANVCSRRQQLETCATSLGPEDLPTKPGRDPQRRWCCVFAGPGCGVARRAPLASLKSRKPSDHTPHVLDHVAVASLATALISCQSRLPCWPAAGRKTMMEIPWSNQSLANGIAPTSMPSPCRAMHASLHVPMPRRQTLLGIRLPLPLFALCGNPSACRSPPLLLLRDSSELALLSSI
jgi:hypothetical protein